jgi:hypothetical protein
MENQSKPSPERWQTVKSERKNQANSKTFIEVKRTKDAETGNEFITIAKGFTAPDGSPRYNKAVTVPLDLIDFVADTLKKMK